MNTKTNPRQPVQYVISVELFSLLAAFPTSTNRCNTMALVYTLLFINSVSRLKNTNKLVAASPTFDASLQQFGSQAAKSTNRIKQL